MTLNSGNSDARKPNSNGSTTYRSLREKALLLERSRATPKPIRHARNREGFFTTIQAAVARGYVWEPRPGVYECPRCPGSLRQEGQALVCPGHVRLYLAPTD